MSQRFTDPTPVGPARVLVVVDTWEIECCAPAPVVGGTTSWMLQFLPGDDEPLLDREAVWSVSRWDDRVTRLDHGVVPAYWTSDAASEPGERRMRGRLVGTVHGGISPDGFPYCVGRVDRIRLLTQVYRVAPDGCLTPVPGTITTADVTECPTTFPIGPIEDGARLPSSVLLDVAVPVSPGVPAG